MAAHDHPRAVSGRCGLGELHDPQGLVAPDERIMGRIIFSPKVTTPQKIPVPVELLQEIPWHHDERRYADLAALVRSYIRWSALRT